MSEDVFSYYTPRKPSQRKKLPEEQRIEIIKQIALLREKSHRLKGQNCNCFHANDYFDRGMDNTCAYHQNEKDISNLEYKINVYDLKEDREKRYFKEQVRREYEIEKVKKKISVLIPFFIVATGIIMSVFLLLNK